MPLIIPDDVMAAARLSEAELLRELAVALFREERLTLARAAQLARMDDFSFQTVLAEREIPMHYGIDEFREDLNTADALRGRLTRGVTDR